MGLLRMQAIEDSGLDAKVTLAARHLLTHIARLNNDYKPASDPFRGTLARLIDATKLNAGHIKRCLRALDKKDIIRLARSEGRYKPEYDITIIAPDYINALELLVRERNTKHSNENGQHDPLTLVTAQGARSHGSAQGARSQNGSAQGARSQNGSAQGARSHSKKKDLRSKDLPLNKAPAAGDPTPTTEFVDSEKVDTHRNGNSADPEITTDPPAPQTNDKIRHEHNQLIDILNRPPVTPEDHKRQEEAQERLYELTRGKKRAPVPDPTPPAAEVDAEPAPLDSERQSQKERQNARLTELLETKAQSPQEYNDATRTIHAQIDKIKDEQLPAAEEADRIDTLIAACIATLDPEPQPDQETTAPKPASSAGKAALELATGPPTTDTGAGEPTEPQPDLFRQAQEADREYRQAKIVHGNRQRKRRKPARNAVHPWIPGQVQQPQHASP